MNEMTTPETSAPDSFKFQSPLIEDDLSILSAQYNNIYTTPGNLSQIRGSGNYSTDYPLSSNWPSSNFNPDTSKYVEGLLNKEHVFPSYGSNWNLDQFATPDNNTNTQWEMTKDQDKIIRDNVASTEDPYLQFGLNANHIAPNALATLFFNKENVDYLQNRIIEDVYNITGIKIKPQNEHSLLIIMNNKYQYALYGSLATTSVVHLALPRQDNAPCSLKDKLTRLNQAVLQETIQQVLSGIHMYMDYYKHASSLPVPLDRPKAMTMKGSRVLQENLGFHGGNSRGIDSFNMRENVIQ